MSQLNLRQLHAAGLLVNDATRRVPEDVEAVRPVTPFDARPIHCWIEHGPAEFIGIEGAAVRLVEDQVLLPSEIRRSSQS